jgi:membrane protease subunit HflC
MATRIMSVFFGLALLVGLSSIFIVDEREVAIKFQLGEIVRSDYQPGLHIKAPWPVNNVRKFDRRILTLDTAPERFLTGEKKNVTVDFFVKWRIQDPATYYTSFQGDERRAAPDCEGQRRGGPVRYRDRCRAHQADRIAG